MNSAQKKRLSPQARWNNTHPKELWAHMALRSAIRRGLIERKPCEVCGAEPADGHHDNYDLPMKVRWLCRRHHRQAHAVVDAASLSPSGSKDLMDSLTESGD